MKNSIIVAIIFSVLGFAVGYHFKPNSTPPKESVEGQKESPRFSQVTSQNALDQRLSRRSAKVIEADDMGVLDEETQKQIELAQKQQQEMLGKQMKKKFDMRIAAIVNELGLNAKQEKALAAFFEKQVQLLSEVNPMEGMMEPDKMKSLAAAVRGDGLEDYMKDYLSDEQMEGLDVYQKRQKKNKIEGLAMKDLSKIQQVLDLTEDQRDSVYSLLVSDAEKKIAEESDTNVVMNGMMQSMGVDMDFGDLDMGELMDLENMENSDEIDSANFMQKMMEDRAKEIDAKVERMASILSESQLKQYRSHLESSGGIFNMMLEGMEVELSE